MVCATGITSQELLSTVLRHGRPLAQGAALGPLLDGEEFLELLRADAADGAARATSGLLQPTTVVDRSDASNLANSLPATGAWK
jgi:hypothetical protein